MNDVKVMPKLMYDFEGKTRRYYPDLYVPSENKFIEVKSTYTYLWYRAKNQAKRLCVLERGFQFEFWICDKTTILYRTDGWETDEAVPWFVPGKRQAVVEVVEEDDDEKKEESNQS